MRQLPWHRGLCTEFPSLSWLAPKQGAALNGIVAVVADVVKDMKAGGEEIPEPLSLKRFRGKIAVRVPPDQHRDLAMEAAEQNVSLNRLIARKLSR